MNRLLKNEKVKYVLMAIGAITVLSGMIIGANYYLTSVTYSTPLLGEGGRNLTFSEDDDMKTLIKKQVLSSIDEGGYLTENDLEGVMSDELFNKVISDVKEKVDTSIANEVASAVDGSTLTDAEIKAIVDREVKEYINSNSSELSEISKLKEQIEALKKADSNLSSKIASSTSGKTGQTGATGKTGATGPAGTPGKDGKSAAEIMGQSETEFKNSLNTTSTNASTAKTTAETAQKTANTANDTASAAKKTADEALAAANAKKSTEIGYVGNDTAVNSSNISTALSSTSGDVKVVKIN